jgi:hypothetical protein
MKWWMKMDGSTCRSHGTPRMAELASMAAMVEVECRSMKCVSAVGDGGRRFGSAVFSVLVAISECVSNRFLGRVTFR